MRKMSQRLRQLYSDLPIQRKINLLNCIIIVIPILFLSVFANKFASDILIEKAVVNAQQNLTLITQSLDNLINSANNASIYCILTNTIQKYMVGGMKTSRLNAMQTIQLEVDGLIGSQSLISSVMICGYHSEVIASSSVNSKLLADAPDARISYRNIFSLHGKARWLPMHTIHYESAHPSTTCVTLIRPVLNLDNANCLGYIALNINDNIISNTYSHIRLAATGRFFIVDQNGKIVSSGNRADYGKNVSKMPYFPYVQKGKTCKVTIDGVKYLVISKKYSKLHWSVIGIAPVKDLTDSNITLTFLIFFTGVICVILATFLSNLLSRSITRPIIRLSRAISAAGRGNLSKKVAVAGSDEIGRLSRDYNTMLDRISHLMDRIYLEQKAKREFELSALQAQINPHFLYNALESIKYLALVQRTEDIFNIITALALFYRTVLSNGESIITIGEEIDNVHNYLTIQKLRYENKLNYTIDVDPDILDKKIIKLSLQPLVENSIYHGIRYIEGKGQISIRGFTDHGDIVISVADNGVGMSSYSSGDAGTRLPEKTNRGFGLRSVDERIKLYFGNKYGIRSIKSGSRQGTTIEIVLPLEQPGV